MSAGMLRLFITLVLLLGTLAATSSPASGQTVPGAATIAGVVVGPDGEPVAGVTVFLRRDAVDLPTRVITDDRGLFRISGVAPGEYRVVASIGSLTEVGPTHVVTATSSSAPITVTLKLGIAEQVSVTSDVWTLPVEPPNSIVSRTTEQLRSQNMFNPEDAIRALPSITVRKRYIGDRNAVIGGRSFGTLQPSRALVYLDGYLLSSFLGRFDAPRWNMVTPEALERVDVLYGPFSAVHPGNSMGTTIVMTERAPRKLEWGLRTTAASQRFDQYQATDRYGAGQLSAYVGGTSRSGLWAAAAFNHQDSVSQPMQWFNVTANAAGTFPVATGAATPVTGILYDTDPRGLARAVFGANAGAIDHTVQDAVKVRAGYSRPAAYDISMLASAWRNVSELRNQTFLRDGAGEEVWQGRVTDGRNVFTIPATAFAPSNREEVHSQLGLTARTHRTQGWNASLILSDYRIIDDTSRLAGAPDPIAAVGGSGSVTRRDGTGWDTAELQASHAAIGNGRHHVTVGVHHNAYRLDNAVRNSDNWLTHEGSVAQRYFGNTGVNAIYAQDTIRLGDAIKLTLGWRAEWFRASRGRQMVQVATCTAGNDATCADNGDGSFTKAIAYGDRTLAGQSPKASVTWTASNSLLLRASYGRAVRFPNVEELYNGTVTASAVTLSDPNLAAERSNAAELSAERFWTRHSVRATFFIDDVRDAILRQTDATVTPSVTRTSNVDRVRTPGLEFVWVGSDLGVRGLTAEANATFADSKVVDNTRDPLMVGKYWLRVPKSRGSVLVAYRPTSRWMGSIGYRHQGRAYNDVYNADIFPNVYGGVSSVNEFDLRAGYKPIGSAEIAIGVDNVTDRRAYQSHPFPGRTVFLEMRLASQ